MPFVVTASREAVGVAADTYYEVLGVAPSATREEIRAAYRKLSRKVHPDAGGTDALFRQIQLAYETLSDPDRRAAYDRHLAAGGGERAAGDPFTGAGAEDPFAGQGARDPWRDEGAGEDGSWWSGGENRPGSQDSNRSGGASSAGAGATRQGARAAWGEPDSSGTGRVPRARPPWFARHPALGSLLLGIVLVSLASSLSPGAGTLVSGLGTLAFGLGLVAALGRRRLRRGPRVAMPGFAAPAPGTGPPSTEASVAFLGRAQLAALAVAALETRGYRRTGLPVAARELFDACVEDGRKRIGVVVVPAVGVLTPELVDAVARAGPALGVHPLVVTASPCSRSVSGLAAARSLGLWDRARLAREVDRAGLYVPAAPGSFGGATPRVLAEELFAGLAALGRALLVVAGWTALLGEVRKGGRAGGSARRR